MDKRTYKMIGDKELQLHTFRPECGTVEGTRACIVFFFGGGFKGGTPEQFHPHCRYLASRGMVAISAEYRTESKHGVSPYACVADAKSAIRWIRAHAQQLGIDPERIAAGGGSAGGHLAAATATIREFDEPGEDTAVSCRPNALLLFNPVYDNGPEGYGHERVSDRWRDFSPLHNIAPGIPPAIVFCGAEDRLVPVETARAFQSEMQALGVRSDLRIYEGQGHGFFNYRDGTNPYYYATLHETDRFLESLGYLQGEPTIANTAPGAHVSGAVGTGDWRPL